MKPTSIKVLKKNEAKSRHLKVRSKFFFRWVKSRGKQELKEEKEKKNDTLNKLSKKKHDNYEENKRS